MIYLIFLLIAIGLFYGLYNLIKDLFKDLNSFIRYNPIFPYVYFILSLVIGNSFNIYGNSSTIFFLYCAGIILFYKFLKFLFVEENNKIPYKKPELIIEPSKQSVKISTPKPKPEPEQKQELEAKPTKFSEVTQSIDDNIEVLPEYKKVLSNLLSTEQTITFVTGGAGTGKSYLIKWLRTQLVSAKTVFLAPTGVASRNIQGLTIHSFCRFKPTLVDFEKGYKTDLDYTTDSHLSGEAKRVEYIIIDEISMVRCDLLDGIDEFFRFFTKSIKPFGGKNVLFVGDLFQLPPIVKTNKDLKGKKSDADYLREMGYGFPFFCFNSHVWENLCIDLITLNQPQRQNNKDFYIFLLA